MRVVGAAAREDIADRRAQVHDHGRIGRLTPVPAAVEGGDGDHRVGDMPWGPRVAPPDVGGDDDAVPRTSASRNDTRDRRIAGEVTDLASPAHAPRRPRTVGSAPARALIQRALVGRDRHRPPAVARPSRALLPGRVGDGRRAQDAEGEAFELVVPCRHQRCGRSETARDERHRALECAGARSRHRFRRTLDRKVRRGAAAYRKRRGDYEPAKQEACVRASCKRAQHTQHALSTDAVVLQLVEQRAVADLEDLRGGRAVAARLLERATDQRLLDVERRLLDRELARAECG